MTDQKTQKGLNGWWQKEISSNFSLVILITVTVAIFIMGAVFAKEYIRIWTEIGQLQQQTIYFPEKPGVLEKLILP